MPDLNGVIINESGQDEGAGHLHVLGAEQKAAAIHAVGHNAAY